VASAGVGGVRPGLAALGLVTLLVVGAVAAGPVSASPAPAAFGHTPPDCTVDGRDQRLETRAGAVTFVSTLADDSTADWDGGRVVRVGASGDCSLAVTNGTASLTAAVVERPGVLTGTVDLGENGSLALVGPDGHRRVALRNDGPAYATSVAVVANGTVRDRVVTPTGRYFDFTLRRDADGTVRLAVWDPDVTRDGDWDVRLDAAPGQRWRVQLRSEAFLDEIAVGTPGATTPTPPGTADDPFPGEEFSSPGLDDADAGGSDPPDDDSAGDAAFLAVLMLVGGGLGFRFAYRLSQFEERIDAIGSTTPWHEVEPADWKVLLNRLVFAGLAVAGGLWLLSILL
jgi:hypothetical protein